MSWEPPISGTESRSKGDRKEGNSAISQLLGLVGSSRALQSNMHISKRNCAFTSFVVCAILLHISFSLMLSVKLSVNKNDATPTPLRKDSMQLHHTMRV